MEFRTGILGAVVGAAVVVAACSPGAQDGAASAESAVSGCGEPASGLPEVLQCTGLYSDIATKTLGVGVRHFTPAVPFWSDGLQKDRWILLPDGKTVDATNMDEWAFPVGTKVWKEIRKGERKIETRYFWKAADGDWRVGAYVWAADGMSAKLHDGNDIDLDGTPYHVPTVDECASCHSGKQEKLLGFEAISLALPGAEGLNLETLVAEKKIAPAPAKTTVNVPDPAFATLHVNCGISCHNGNEAAYASWSGLHLRLGFDEVTTKPASEWNTFKTAVDVATMREDRGPMRVKPGYPAESAIFNAMNVRDGDKQMPPLASQVVDTESVAIVESWIKSLGGTH